MTTPNTPITASKVAGVAELVRRLCLAESIGRIFSVNHPKGKGVIRGAFDALVPILEQDEMLAISMAEGNILVGGMPIEERNPIVSRFVSAFQQIHVDNLLFAKGLTVEEFEGFFRVLLQGPKVINTQGGLAAMLKAQGVEHVQIQQISYVMVREDEKVVSRDAQMVEGQALPPPLDDEQLIRYMVREVLKKAEERRWLVNEIKNNPRRIASLITEGIELASARAEAGLTTEKTIEGLLENIKLIGQNLVDAKTGDVSNDDALQKAIMTLESEVRVRSSKLMSSTTAVGFVNEVLAVITHYADRVRAKQISDEVLKGEKSMRQTEKLLQSLTPTDASRDTLLQRLRDQLVKDGVTPEQFEQLAETAKPKTPRPRKPREPRVSKPVHDVIAERLKSRGVTDDQSQQIATQLGDFFEREFNVRTKELKQQNRQMTEQLTLVDEFLGGINIAVVVWNRAGIVSFIDDAAKSATGLKSGDKLDPELLAVLSSERFPLGAALDDVCRQRGWGETRRALLSAIERIVADKSGAPLGAVFRPLSSTP